MSTTDAETVGDLEGDAIVVVTKRASTRSCAHTDEECPKIKNPGNMMEKEAHLLFDDLAICRYCSGRERMGPTDQRNIRKQLADGNPEDFGLTPLGERGDV